MDSIFSNPIWNIAIALIIGLIIGFLVFSPILKKGSEKIDNEMDAAGTIAKPEAKPDFVLPIEIPGVVAKINILNKTQDFVELVIDISSEEINHLSIFFNKGDFNLWSSKIVKRSDICSILNGYNSVEIVNKGDNTTAILLKKMNKLENELRIVISVNNSKIYEQTVTIK